MSNLLYINPIPVKTQVRLHTDNCLTSKAQHSDVLKCIEYIRLIRSGQQPLLIPGLIEFANNLSHENQRRFVAYTMSIM